MLVALGVGITMGAGATLVWRVARRPHRAPWPAYGWFGLGALAILETLLALHVHWVATFFTALAWTAYVAAADAGVYALRGDSPLHHPAQFACTALLSVPSWLIFEAYNLRLHNWVYVGVPSRFPELALGAGWAFATIFPGIFETADLLYSAAAPQPPARRRRVGPGLEAGAMIAGAAMLALPPLAPAALAPYLFAPVWGGVILLLDPINHRRGLASLLGAWEDGEARFCGALLAAGAICGFLWEFWNYWAIAQWRYIFPILPQGRIFAMPAPGFLGFPPFALECFALLVWLEHDLLPPALRGRWATGTGRDDVQKRQQMLA